MAHLTLNEDGSLIASINKKKKKAQLSISNDGQLTTNNSSNNINTKKQSHLDLLDDGWQFGDLTKMFLGEAKQGLDNFTKTTLNTGANIAYGTAQGLEKTHDTLSDISSKVNLGLEKLVGLKSQKEYDEARQRERERIAKNYVNDFVNESGLSKTWDKLEEGSVITRDNLGGKISQGIGEMLPTIIVGKMAGVSAPKLTSLKGLSGTQKATTLLKNVGKTAITQLPANTTLAMSSYGGALEEAYRNGATDDEAMKYALGSTATELATEWITGGIPGVNDKGLLDSLQDKALDKVSNSLAKFLIKSGYSVIGEGTEEALSEMINPILKNATYSQGEKVDWNAVVESAIVGGLTGGILNTPANISSYNADVNTAKLKQQQISNQATQNFIEQNNLKPTQINTNEISLPKIDTNQEVNVQQNLEKLGSKQNNNMYNFTGNAKLDFSDQVDQWKQGNIKQNEHLVVLKEMPELYRQLGLENQPMTLISSKLDRVYNKNGKQSGRYHGLGELVKQLPEAIDKPLNIIESKDDSIVAITDLSDDDGNIVIASIKINGNGQIEIDDVSKNIPAHVLTSSYGRENYDYQLKPHNGDYTGWMEENKRNGRIIYDIDEGIKKQRVNGQWLSLPNSKNSFSTDNNTTNLTKSQIAPLPSQYSMQQNVENDTKIPSSKEFIPKNPTKESTYDDFKEEKKTAQLLEKRPIMEKPSVKDNYHTFIREMVDKGEAINRLAKKTGNKELYAKYDHMGTAEAEGNYAIAIAQTDNKGNKIGKSVVEIWKPVEDAGLVEEFSNYLLHKHNIARWQQGKPVFGEEVTSDISKKFVEESEKKYPQFTEWSKDINTYNKNQMQNMVDAGLTSKESQEYLNNTYDNYVRIYSDVRGSSPITQFRGNLKVNLPIKKAKGGNQDILPLKDSMAQQTIETKKAIRRNEFGLELLNVLNNGENVEYDGKQQIVKNDDGTYSFTIFKDGQPIKMEIDEGIYEAIKPTEIKNPKLLAPIRGLSKIQRGLLTDKNPLFIATNFFKDIGDAPFNSKYGSKFAKNYIIAAKEIMNNSELWNRYRALGGEQNTYFDYESGVKVPSNSKVSKFIRKIQSINQVVEQLPRFTEFISTLEAGGTEAQAMYNAAEVTTNFKRGGDVAKALNRNGANFLNASIQGFDKQIRNFTGQNGVKGYVNLLAKATILGILPSVLNHLLLDDDEDYQELPDYIKDSYFLFKTGDGKFIRIPKGRVVSTFGMTARRTLEYADGEKDAFDGLLNQISNQVAPNNPLEDNVFAPFLAIKNNRSWNGSEIVPQRLQNELSENQYDEKTDAISKFIGKTFKVSPKKVNYLLDQYTGGIGDVILPMLSPEANQNPISAKFTTDSVMNNKYVSEFYDTKDKLTKQSNSLKATDEDILKTKYINSMGSKMNNLYKEKREIQNSNLSNKEKLLKVKEVQQKINDIAKFSLEDYENVYIDGNYGTVGELDFYKGTNGEWTKATNDLIEKQNNISAKYDITASEFYNNREEYTYAYNNPEKYSVIKQITSFDKYNIYKEKIDDIRANTTNDKTETIKYINSLNLSIPQKAMFIRMYYPSFDNYNTQIVNYVKKNTKTVEERTQILTKLGFTIKNGRVYW